MNLIQTSTIEKAEILYEKMLNLNDLMSDLTLQHVTTGTLLKCQRKLQKIELHKLEEMATKEQKIIIAG